MGLSKFIFVIGASAFAINSWAQLSSAPPAEDPAAVKKVEGRELDHSNDPLDDAAEVQLQQALNDIYNSYNSQISALQGQRDSLASGGMRQCEVDAGAAKSQADQNAAQAKQQGLMNMIGPGAETLGHLVEAGMGAAGSEKKDKEAQLQKMISACEGTKVLDCDKNGAEPIVNAATCTAAGFPTTTDPTMGACRQYASSEASRYTSKLSSISRELKDLGGATNELLGSGAQLLASGLVGSMTGKTADQNAALQKAAAEQGEEFCKLQVQNQLNEMTRQLAQLESAKARDLLMANMQATYQTKLRRDALNGEIPEEIDLSGLYQGGVSALNDPNLIDPNSLLPPVRTVGGGGSSGSEGSAAPAAGGAAGGGSGGAPAWGFGGAGDGTQGGNALPAQPKGAKYTGSALSAANSGKGGSFGGGFGTLEDKGPAGEGEETQIQQIGDGGLKVLLARTSIIHARHAAELVKGIDFKKLAKASAIPQKAAPAAADRTPAARY